MIDGREVYDTKRSHTSLQLPFIVIPFNLFGGQDQQAFLNFLVHFVTLLGQQTFLDDCQRIFREHVTYLFDYQPLLRFGRYVRLISQILSKQNVV